MVNNGYLFFLFVSELSLFLMLIFFQKEAFKYGIRKLTKKKMVKVLTDIYEKTHSGSSNSDKTRNAPQNSQGQYLKSKLNHGLNFKKDICFIASTSNSNSPRKTSVSQETESPLDSSLDNRCPHHKITETC